MNRKPGFYKVEIDGEHRIIRYQFFMWFIGGYIGLMTNDSEFDSIDEKMYMTLDGKLCDHTDNNSIYPEYER